MLHFRELWEPSSYYLSMQTRVGDPISGLKETSTSPNRFVLPPEDSPSDPKETWVYHFCWCPVLGVKFSSMENQMDTVAWKLGGPNPNQQPRKL